MYNFTYHVFGKATLYFKTNHGIISCAMMMVADF